MSVVLFARHARFQDSTRKQYAKKPSKVPHCKAPRAQVGIEINTKWILPFLVHCMMMNSCCSTCWCFCAIGWCSRSSSRYGSRTRLIYELAKETMKKVSKLSGKLIGEPKAIVQTKKMEKCGLLVTVCWLQQITVMRGMPTMHDVSHVFLGSNSVKMNQRIFRRIS